MHVDEGVVWLSGYVKSTGQQLLALDMARFVPGVKTVVNDLSIVRPEDQKVTASSETAPAELNADSIRPTAATESVPAAPAQEAASRCRCKRTRRQ